MNNEIKLPVWRCEKCGSNNVEQLAWVQLNTANPNITFLETNDREDYWCDQCQDNTKIKITDEGRKRMV